MSTYWFVSGEHLPKRDVYDKIPFNTIVKDIHPVLWAARPTANYRESYLVRLLFFCEIPEAVALAPETLSYFTFSEQ